MTLLRPHLDEMDCTICRTPPRASYCLMFLPQVIHQVDKKFLACLINATDQNMAASSENEGMLLYIFITSLLFCLSYDFVILT